MLAKSEIKKIHNISHLVKITMCLLTITHFSYGIIFYFCNIHEMFIVKTTEAIIALIVTIITLKIDRLHNIAVYFTHLSILISCAICTYILGQDYGFLVVMITILTLGYVHDFRTNKYPILIGILEVLFFIVTIIITKDIPDYDSEYKHFFYIFNTINIACIVLFYSGITISIDEKAVERLNNENEKINEKVEKDYLTGILNRRKMNEKIKKYYDLLKREQIQSMILVLGDVDNFKKINDECGHDFGDIVLKNIANTISEGISNGYVARWGGEEFLILLSNMSVEDCENLINTIRSDCYNKKHGDGYYLKSNISITFGICYSLRVENIDYMLSQADNALYKGKKSGKNKIETVVLG